MPRINQKSGGRIFRKKSPRIEKIKAAAKTKSARLFVGDGDIIYTSTQMILHVKATLPAKSRLSV